MKKIFSILLCLLMIASIAVSSVSAAGAILFEDKFNSMDNEDWCWEPSHFYVENGVLVGDPTAVVHQTMYGANPPWIVLGVSSPAVLRQESPIIRILPISAPGFGSRTTTPLGHRMKRVKRIPVRSGRSSTITTTIPALSRATISRTTIWRLLLIRFPKEP